MNAKQYSEALVRKDRRIAELEAAIERLKAHILRDGVPDVEIGGCPICGYNGFGYYQPDKHECARWTEKDHAASIDSCDEMHEFCGERRRTDYAAGAQLDEELRVELAEANAMLRMALYIHLHEDADADEYTDWLRSRVRAEAGSE